MKPAFMTALGVRSSRPSVVKTQHSPKANTSISAIAATTPGTPAVGPVAEDHAEHDDHGPRDDVAHRVAEQRADERRGPPDRQPAEAVHDALGQVGVERTPE